MTFLAYTGRRMNCGSPFNVSRFPSIALSLKRKLIFILCPLCRCNYVLRRHGRGQRFAFSYHPSGESITFLGRGCGRGYLCAIRKAIIRLRAVNIPGYRVYIRYFSELSRIGSIFSSKLKFRLPADELVCILRRSSLGRIILAIAWQCVILCFRRYGFLTIYYPCDVILLRFPLCLYAQVLRRHCCGDVLIPTDKHIAFLGRGFGCVYLRAVVRYYGCNFSAAVRIERYGVLIYSPLRRYVHVLCGHGCGNRLIPTGEGIACLARILGCGHCRIVILRYGRDIAAAIRIERYGVLVYSPLGRYGYVFSRHCHRDVLIPTGEGIAYLGRVCGHDYLRAVVLRYGRNFRTSVRIKRYSIFICAPAGIERKVSGRHCRQPDNVAIFSFRPAYEMITLIAFVLDYRNVNFSTIFIIGRHLFFLPIYERYMVCIYLPPRCYGHVLRGHGCGNRLIPACEGMARLGRVCGCGYIRAVVLRYRRNRCATVRIERYGVLIYFPLRRYGNVLCGHGFGYRPIPLYKGIACLGRVCGLSYLCTIVLRYGPNRTAAVRIERYGVLINRPLGRYGHVLRGHGCGDVLIPTGEGVTCLGRGCGCGYLLVIALLYRRNRCAAVRIERYGILNRRTCESGRISRVAADISYRGLPTAELIAVMLVRILSGFCMSRLHAISYFFSFFFPVNHPCYFILPCGFAELRRIGCVAVNFLHIR